MQQMPNAKANRPAEHTKTQSLNQRSFPDAHSRGIGRAFLAEVDTDLLTTEQKKSRDPAIAAEQ